MRFLTQEWLDRYRELAADQPERPGASARVQYVITRGPDGDVRYWWIVEDGRLVDAQLGEVPDPDFTWTTTYDVQQEVSRGDLDANAAFMQGRVKVAGDMGRLMQILPVTRSPEFEALQAQVRAETEY